MISYKELFSIIADNAKEVRELYVMDRVSRIGGPPSSEEFGRKYVAKNIPCIFTDATKNWPALAKWNADYLKKALQNKSITVASTPNGYGDAISNDMFMLPQELQISMDEAMSHLCSTTRKDKDSIYYIQKQNSNLFTEFSELIEDVSEHLPWATDTFGRRPDAVNFWMGNSDAVTSLHKDHYENLYCVITGKKIFTLYPPTDRPFIPYKQFKVGRYINNNGEWDTVETSDFVPWIPVDPLKPDYQTYPQFKLAKPIRCEVKAGETLYLPALWFHHVQQADSTIAVNYWYDMDFDMKYTYYKLLEKLSSLSDCSDIA